MQTSTAVAIFIVLGAVLFYLTSHSSTQTIGALVLITLWAAAGGAWIWWNYRQERQAGVTALAPLKKEFEAAAGQPVYHNNYFLKTFGKRGLKYLPENEKLVDIARDLLFCRISDPWRYRQLLLLMDKMQKTYMYILADRYLAKSYAATFTDLRDQTLENLYSFYIVIPTIYKHVYGLNPHDVLQKNIAAFIDLAGQMSQTLDNYRRHHLREPQSGDHIAPRAADTPFDPMQSRRLP